MSEDKWPKSAPNPQINGQMYCICIENELDMYKNEVIHMANAVLQTRIDKATKGEAIADKFKAQKDWKIGVISSVTINHARIPLL